jgi:AcrR family transcriptional regulator
MPRTVNREQHTVRREAFLDVAQRLIQRKGYEEMSVQDVLEELGASKGAFYHYFDSKLALLEAVVDRFADQALARVAPILADPDLPAVRKLERVFGDIAAFKAEQKELVLAIIGVWNSDSNALVREKLRRLSMRRLAPLLAAFVRQGVEEGSFGADPAEETAMVLVTLMAGFQEQAAEYFVARQAGTITFEAVRRSVAAFTRAYERILGIPAGSLTLTDEATLHFWFG